MVQYKIIKECAERVRAPHPYRAILIPSLTDARPGSLAHVLWAGENDHLVNLTVKAEDKPHASELVCQLYNNWLKMKDLNDPEAARLIAELKKLKVKDFSEFTPIERWSQNAKSMVEYSGDVNLMCLIAQNLSTYTGNVLEVFCGHNSYFERKRGRNITALDYCEESLLRYSHKKAKKICCDLNQVSVVGDLSFLESNSFDVVSICFGYKYPKDIVLLMSEFRRILKPGGVLSFIESYTHGYHDLACRKFDIKVIRRELLRAGFSKVSVQPINQTPGKFRRKREELVYHTQAIK